MRTPRVQLASFLLCAIPLLSGCQVVTGSSQYAQVRFVDISPDAPAVDLYQNAASILYNVGSGTATSYIPVAPGAYNWSVRTAGLRQQLASASASVTAGSQYTVLVADTTASLQMSLIKDQSAPASAGQAAVRVLHQATRAGAVDLYLVSAGSTLAASSPVATGIVFGTAPHYLTFPSGTYSLMAVPTGAASPVPLYAGTQTDFASRSVRTIVLYDPTSSDGSNLQALTAEDVVPAS